MWLNGNSNNQICHTVKSEHDLLSRYIFIISINVKITRKLKHDVKTQSN